MLTIGAAYQLEPNVAYSDIVNKTGAKDYKAWTVDAFFEYPISNIGTATLSGAYADYSLDNAYQGANPDSGTIGLNGEKNGYYMKAGYMLPNLPLQLFARYEKWSFANLDGVYNQRVNLASGGANYYFRDQNLKLTFEASNTGFHKGTGTTVDGSKDFMTYTTQLQLIF